MRFEITAVNPQELETHIVAHGKAEKDAPWSFAAHNSTISIWLKKEEAAKYKVGDTLELSKAE